MQVTNVSARLHSVGGVRIAPGETKEIPAEFETAIDTAELVPVAEPAKRGRPAKVEAVAEPTETEASGE
jgi:hypothetical protein